MSEGVIGQRFARREIVIGGIREVFPLDRDAVCRRRLVENRYRRIDHFGTDPVAGDDGDAVGKTRHRSSVIGRRSACAGLCPAGYRLPNTDNALSFKARRSPASDAIRPPHIDFASTSRALQLTVRRLAAAS